MSDPDDFLRENEIDPAERARLIRVARRLERERPLPNPTFRGELRRRLAFGAAQAGRVPGLRRLALSCGASGLSLFAMVGAGVAGIGPFAV